LPSACDVVFSPGKSWIKKAMAEQKKDFFISYNGKDQDWAVWIAWQLEEAGYSVIIQAWDFRPGGNFVMEMQKATTQTDRTLVVLSPNYLAGQFTQPEWAAAFAQDPTGEKGTLLYQILLKIYFMRQPIPCQFFAGHL
jgi:hypothetical protein